MKRFNRNVGFASLSIKDLLDGRDQYHVHLANLDHVIGTAIGRYRIRLKDPNLKDPSRESTGDLGPRTLANSAVTKWSWPCVLVFVDAWVSQEQFGKSPENYVPPRLY